ncbi:BT4734/BF3469 family protein [Bacteroides caccae]|uniref:BT4734-like N-terminal domain-containing protein n=1 Tax=Bacteroides caccae TaxID=47678 RepID=A0A414FDJ7_9BACE|nr:BT4734/BF3469 family protein [Bacteroides caccae]RHD44597.1 hypothetical protein DW794_17435 [Bacteroides caccae]
MHKITLNVPEGIRYLSEWHDLWNTLLPEGQHYILNKRICGCGATEAYLRSGRKVILASPRKHLLYNKYSQHLSDNLHLYRYQGDKKRYFENTGNTEKDILTFNNELGRYLQSGGRKILTTYDSLGKIVEVLLSSGECLQEWIVVVDEFQSIFCDCQYKATTEYEFSMILGMFSTVIYLSATPFLESYLDMTGQFGGLTVYELLWPANMTQIPEVEVIKSRKSVASLCARLVDDYRKGNGKSILVDRGKFIAGEAVFYINSISEIKKIILENNIRPEEANIICSSKPENIRKLDKLSRETGMKFRIGDIPQKGELHKMFTFCTSTVYIGADFYSTNAYSYIFANPRISSMTVDVSVDLQQIIGRQRLEENPFRNSATLYFNTRESRVDRQALEEAVKEKKEKTQRQIKNYTVAPYKNEMLQMMEETIRKYGHKEHYCCIVRDSNGRVCVVENEILEIADRRAWEVTNMIYNNDFSMYRALKAGVNVTKATDSNNPEIQRIFREWNMDNRFDRKARMYCDLHENAPLLLEECNFIERKYKDYYDALGREGFEDSYWRENYIKQALAPVPIRLLPRNEIAGRLMNVLKAGGEYTKSEIKEILRGIYHDLGIQGKPSASDITGYLTCEEKNIRTKRTVKAMFRIISHAREKVSLFPRITDVNQPQEYDVDKLLEIIRDDTYFHLKAKVEAVRNAGTKDEKNRKKALLPVVTWNGTFKSKHKNECTVYSSYTALDFDHIEPKDMPAFAGWLQGFSCVYAYFITPGGTGYKAIIIHDNCEPLYHYDLYEQLLKMFDCPWIDNSTTDLARGNYLSYDPALWKNPNPIPFHFVPTTSEPVIPNTMTETVIRDVQGEPVLVQDESWVEGFLNQLNRQVISDDSIIRILRKTWNGNSLSNGRNNTAMSYAGILCKAGVEPDKAKAFIEELIPGFDITEIVGYAYTHNIFGCERMRYRNKK